MKYYLIYGHAAGSWVRDFKEDLHLSARTGHRLGVSVRIWIAGKRGPGMAEMKACGDAALA